MANPTQSQFDLFANLANPNRVDLNKPPINGRQDVAESTVLKNTPFVTGSAANSRASSRKSSRHSSRHSSRASKRSRKSRSPSPPPKRRPSSATSERSTTSRKLGLLMELKKMRMQGVHLTREYSTGDSVEDLEFEVNRQQMNMDTVNSVALMRDTLKLVITGVELANNRLGPFLNLDGWSGGATSDMHRYDHCLERLYKKYFRKGSMDPMLELGFLLISSAFMFHVKAKFTGPPPISRNVPFEPPRAQNPRRAEAPSNNSNRMPRPRMRPPKQSMPGMQMPPMPDLGGMGIPGLPPTIPLNMPRINPPRPPQTQRDQETPEIVEMREEVVQQVPKIIDTNTGKTKNSKKSSKLTVEKQGDVLNFNDLSDDED